MPCSSHCFFRFWLEPSFPWAQLTEMAAYTLEMSSSMSMGFQWLARPTAMSSTLCTMRPGTGRSTSLWEERCYVEVCNSRQQQELEVRWWDVFVRHAKDVWNKILNPCLYYMRGKNTLDILNVTDFESADFHPTGTISSSLWGLHFQCSHQNFLAKPGANSRCVCSLLFGNASYKNIIAVKNRAFENVPHCVYKPKTTAFW